MDIEFSKRRSKYERQMEDLIIAISGERTVTGLDMCINIIPVVTAFNNLLDHVEDARLFTRAVLTPGIVKDE